MKRTKRTKIKARPSRLTDQRPFHLMMLPGMILLAIFWLVPLIYGLYMPFINYKPAKGFAGSDFVGLKYFKYMFHMKDFQHALVNTVVMAVAKLILGLIIPVVFALLINEASNRIFNKSLQTIVFFPHFISWVLLAGVMIDFLSPSTGLLNQVLKLFGHEPIFFLADNKYFRWTMILSDTWKEFGWSSIVYLACISSIDPSLYESAVIDGAGRFKQALYVTLPSMLPLIVLSAVLSVGNILSANFDQILNLYSAAVYETGDVLDTLVYRIGLVNRQYSLSAAVSLVKSVVSICLISASYKVADKAVGYRVI